MTEPIVILGRQLGCPRCDYETQEYPDLIDARRAFDAHSLSTHPRVVVGFTGTQLGMTEDQKDALSRILVDEDVTELHHGDCIGADDEAHAIATDLHITVVIHPPENEAKRAWCHSEDMRRPRPYLDRNHAIVDLLATVRHDGARAFLIAAPKGPEVLRSGTWATVRYARNSAGVRTEVLYP